ncbi:MAG: hypothetical protein C0453_06280 [Comamonadaceae bacterium]|nr:hypothetical protein [Comamonadaceae bacterium]
MNGTNTSSLTAPGASVHQRTRLKKAHRLACAAAPILLAGLLGACAPQGAGTATPVATPAPSLPPGVEGMACTMDVIQCSNGDWVGRKPPGCQFTCPAGSVPLPASR